MNIRKAKKLHSDNIYLKEIITLLKAGNSSKYKKKKGVNCPKKLRDTSHKIRKSFINFFNKIL